MAKINFIEKQKLERILNMDQGYVLDFSNRTFQEFIKDCLDIDIYKNYPNLSKAKILRAILENEKDIYVGKLINQLLKYKKEFHTIADNEKEDFIFCIDLSNRLLGKVGVSEKKVTVETNKSIDFDEIKRKLYSVTLIEKPNERGFEFEKFLNYFFEQFRLNPRPSYKIIGEQIDGSFSFNNCTYLVEAKWKKEIIGIDDLRIFSDKIISKSAFTRGLFISFSNFNDYIFQRYNNNHARFILMTVQELFILAERKMDFKELLIKKIRVLEEEGIVFRNIMELN
ncbi:MAG: hypothetical protein IPL26_07090 [Leptospiraceae bacterium]|nr:hypothetical protein [Leptospiraceae bacterium]